MLEHKDKTKENVRVPCETGIKILEKNLGGVSYETAQKLAGFVDLLCDWNERMNLVAASTLPAVWERHILDSAQLVKFLPTEKKIIADLGSGAGFPGLVLAIMTGHEIHLVESIGKKADFLRTAADVLGLSNVTVHRDRIEDLRGLRADIVTARALKALPELLGLASGVMKGGAQALFLKGQSVDAELTEASKYWRFSHEKHQSLSDPSGSVLIVRDLHRIKPAGHVAKRSRKS